jgi:hypothetical protein
MTRIAHRATEYLDRLPVGWFVLDVMRTEWRSWDWVALIVDANPDCDDFTGPRPWDLACWIRIPGKHGNRDAAWEALGDLISTRH